MEKFQKWRPKPLQDEKKREADTNYNKTLNPNLDHGINWNRQQVYAVHRVLYTIHESTNLNPSLLVRNIITHSSPDLVISSKSSTSRTHLDRALNWTGNHTMETWLMRRICIIGSVVNEPTNNADGWAEHRSARPTANTLRLTAHAGCEQSSTI